MTLVGNLAGVDALAAKALAALELAKNGFEAHRETAEAERLALGSLSLVTRDRINARSRDYYDKFRAVCAAHADGPNIRVYVFAAFTFARHMRSFAQPDDAFNAENIERTLKLLSGWQDTEFIVAALGYETPTFDEWAASISGTITDPIGLPLWHKVFQEKSADAPVELNARRWREANRQKLEAVHVRGVCQQSRGRIFAEQ